MPASGSYFQARLLYQEKLGWVLVRDAGGGWRGQSS